MEGAGLLTMPVVMLSGHATIETAVEAPVSVPSIFWKSRSACKKLLSTVQRALKGGPGQNVPALSILLTLAKARSSTNCARLPETLVNRRRTALLTGEVGVGFL